MIDRTTLNLRFDAHAHLTKMSNNESWQGGATIPIPGPRAAVAALLLALATRLDRTRPTGRREVSPAQGAPA